MDDNHTPDVQKTPEIEIGTPPKGKDWAIFAVILPFFTVVFDQWSKFAATKFFNVPMSICETSPNPGFDTDVFWVMDLALVCNFGISWGLLQGDSPFKRWALTAFAFAMCGFMLVLFRQSRDMLMRISLGFVIGGAIGNGIDRALFGAVTDFIDFGDIGFHWVFNIADSAITVGVIGLIISSFRMDKLEKNLKAKS